MIVPSPFSMAPSPTNFWMAASRSLNVNPVAFFNAFRVPYTQIGMRYDFIHHDWHGPNIGETYDPGPAAPQPPTGPPPPPVR